MGSLIMCRVNSPRTSRGPWRRCQCPRGQRTFRVQESRVWGFRLRVAGQSFFFFGLWLMVDGWWLMVDGRWLMVDGWWLRVDSWWLMVDGWWLMVTGWWLMVAGCYEAGPARNRPRGETWISKLVTGSNRTILTSTGRLDGGETIAGAHWPVGALARRPAHRTKKKPQKSTLGIETNFTFSLVSVRARVQKPRGHAAGDTQPHAKLGPVSESQRRASKGKS